MGKLPLELTTFVGRRREMAEVKRWLSTSRMVTLTGPGGTGKTRLAREAAATLTRAFSDRVWLIELDGSQDSDPLDGAVAAAVGLVSQSRTALIDYLAPHHALLIVDGCEHVAQPVAELAEALLRSCPHLRILATSRHRLNAVGEVTLAVPPLGVPDPSRSYSASEISAVEAVALFVDRAAARAPDLDLEVNRRAVTEICCRLGGLPLAIELATGRLGALSVQQVAARLDDRFALVSAGPHGMPARQRSLLACISWSYDMCTERERRLWARLSIFEGSFHLDAASDICGTAPLSAAEMLDTLAGLLDKSILIHEQHDTFMRYRLPESIREFGLDRLREFGEYTELNKRHRYWYNDLTARINTALGMGLAAWWRGEVHQAGELLIESLQLKKKTDDLLGVGWCLEALAWIAVETDGHRAAALLGAASALQCRAAGTFVAVLPDMATFHEICENQARSRLGEQLFAEAFRFGGGLVVDDAAAYALGEKLPPPLIPVGASRLSGVLTPREREVAQLVARGMSNKEIAARLLIALRTAEGHIEHILTKLGFKSRAQIAAWAVELDQREELCRIRLEFPVSKSCLEIISVLSIQTNGIGMRFLSRISARVSPMAISVSAWWIPPSPRQPWPGSLQILISNRSLIAVSSM